MGSNPVQMRLIIRVIGSWLGCGRVSYTNGLQYTHPCTAWRITSVPLTPSRSILLSNLLAAGPLLQSNNIETALSSNASVYRDIWIHASPNPPRWNLVAVTSHQLVHTGHLNTSLSTQSTYTETQIERPCWAAVGGKLEMNHRGRVFVQVSAQKVSTTGSTPLQRP